MLRALVAVVTAGMGAGAAAQGVSEDGNLYDGTWNVRFECGRAAPCPARLVIADFAGTWRDVSAKGSAKAACGGKDIPVTVQSSTRALLAFTVWGDGDSPTCPTLSILVKPRDAKTLEGSFETGAHATESPEVHASHSLPATPSSEARDKVDKAISGRTTSARTIRMERR